MANDQIAQVAVEVLENPTSGKARIAQLVAEVLCQNIVSPAYPPAWPAVTPPNGVITVAYSFTWTMTGVGFPTTYTLLSGSLPSGLSLNTVGGPDNVGEVTGTPTEIGTFTFTIRASNSYGTADKEFTIEIALLGAGAGVGSMVWMA